MVADGQEMEEAGYHAFGWWFRVKGLVVGEGRREEGGGGGP